MAGELVLITGATGHLGFRTLRYALEAGYSVRAAVRSEAKAESIKSNSAVNSKERQAPLSFVVVPDILADGAYDEAVKDVKFIIHIASPLAKPSEDLDKSIVQPAIKGTMNILEAAKKTTSVQRIVITSSTVAIADITSFTHKAFHGPAVNAETRIAELKGPFTHPWKAYEASKTAALNRAEAWVAKNKPNFDVIHILPSYIEGRNDLAKSTADALASGANGFILSIALGNKVEAPNVMITNHVDDNAWVHVQALNPKIAGNQSFLVTNSGSDGVEWNDVNDIVARNFPESVKKGILKKGDTPTYHFHWDAKKTEETFGFRFQSFESQVVSVVQQYLELFEKENGGK